MSVLTNTPKIFFKVLFRSINPDFRQVTFQKAGLPYINYNMTCSLTATKNLKRQVYYACQPKDFNI